MRGWGQALSSDRRIRTQEAAVGRGAAAGGGDGRGRLQCLQQPRPAPLPRQLPDRVTQQQEPAQGPSPPAATLSPAAAKAGPQGRLDLQRTLTVAAWPGGRDCGAGCRESKAKRRCCVRSRQPTAAAAQQALHRGIIATIQSPTSTLHRAPPRPGGSQTWRAASSPFARGSGEAAARSAGISIVSVDEWGPAGRPPAPFLKAAGQQPGAALIGFHKSTTCLLFPNSTFSEPIERSSAPLRVPRSTSTQPVGRGHMRRPLPVSSRSLVHDIAQC